MVQPLSLDASYEDLMAQKMSGIDNSLDKREGTSMIFNATAANSAETVQMLAALKTFRNIMFADTAPREELLLLGAERGLKPTVATKAKLKGVFNIDVPIGSRFSLDQLNYVVTDRIDQGEYILEAETTGEIGNMYLGSLIPIEYIEGLGTAELTDVLIPGEDEEDTELFRAQYFNSFEAVAFGGNRADYKSKVEAIEGVGGVRVYRAWNGGGTVKLVIIDSQFNKPSQILVDTVQELVDPLGQQGEGVGIAPIDHMVTIKAVDEVPINITLNITYQSGWAWADIEPQVLSVIDAYFKELAGQWASAVTFEDDHAGIIVRISQIETRLLGVPGVIDIANTKLNDGTSNIELDKEAIPKRGVVSG